MPLKEFANQSVGETLCEIGSASASANGTQDIADMRSQFVRYLARQRGAAHAGVG
jgi:hypothetical protein